VGRPTPLAVTSTARLDSLVVDDDRISARLLVGDQDHTITYNVPGVALEDRYEAFVVAALPIAMRLSASLSVPQPVSARLLDGLPTAQRILNAWDDCFRIVNVDAAREVLEPDGQRGSACFFTGGVDSFYTAIANLDALDALVYVHGFDIALEEHAKRERISESLRGAAADLGRPLIEVVTDLRTVSDRYCGWPLYHGAALASVGLLLGRRFQRILVPATHSYRDLFPWGSHPLLDLLWSTETVEFVHSGPITRIEKLTALSRSEMAMQRLRVCWQQDPAYNCGRCEKCLRTMAGLRIVGALERCATLPNPVPLRALARVPVRDENTLAFARENLEAAEARGSDPSLIRALRRPVRIGTWYLALKPRGHGVTARVWTRAVRTVRRVRHTRARVRRSIAGLRPTKGRGRPGDT
jgi:hypothetical protein